MCCFLTALILLGPRAGILVWWLINPVRWNLAFTTFIWPLLGFIFLPWTTLMYVVVFPGGLVGFDWIWLGLGLVIDIGSHVGGGFTNRDKIPGYGSEPQTIEKTPPAAAAPPSEPPAPQAPASEAPPPEEPPSQQ